MNGIAAHVALFQGFVMTAVCAEKTTTPAGG